MSIHFVPSPANNAVFVAVRPNNSSGNGYAVGWFNSNYTLDLITSITDNPISVHESMNINRAVYHLEHPTNHTEVQVIGRDVLRTLIYSGSPILTRVTSDDGIHIQPIYAEPAQPDSENGFDTLIYIRALDIHLRDNSVLKLNERIYDICVNLKLRYPEYV